MSNRKRKLQQREEEEKESHEEEANQGEEEVAEEEEDDNQNFEGDEDSEGEWSFSGEESEEDDEDGGDEEDQENGKDQEQKEGGKGASKWQVAQDDEGAEDDDFASNQLEIALDPKTKKMLDSKIANFNKKENKAQEKRGVIYLGRIPHGFYERQMRAFFNQFGKVTRLRLSRSKKTGNSKYYAFIEFEYEEVAKIVAETMHNYLLFDHILKCYVLAEDKIHPNMFKGANKKFATIDWKKIEQKRRTQPQSTAKIVSRINNLKKNEKKKREKLKNLGIDYEFPGYNAILPENPKHVKFD